MLTGKEEPMKRLIIGVLLAIFGLQVTGAGNPHNRLNTDEVRQGTENPLLPMNLGPLPCPPDAHCGDLD